MDSNMQKRGTVADANYGYAVEPPPPQSEVEREWVKLLDTADALDSTVGKLVGRIEKITRPEPPIGPETKGELPPVCGTIMGRNLNDLNSRLRHSMMALQSTIQRIEL